MASTRTRIEEFFQAHGIRSTPQRFAVMQFLMRSPVHASAEEIFEAVNRLDPRASRATIYNNLRDLVQAGLVREVVLEARTSRYEAHVTKHHHFICDHCGGVEDIAWFDIPASGRKRLGSRTVRDCEMIVRGLCETCGNGNKDAKAAERNSQPARMQ